LNRKNNSNQNKHFNIAIESWKNNILYSNWFEKNNDNN